MSPSTSPSNLRARADCLLQRDVDSKMPASGCRRLWRLQFGCCLLLVALSVKFSVNSTYCSSLFDCCCPTCILCNVGMFWPRVLLSLHCSRQSSSQHVPPQMMGLMKLGVRFMDGGFREWCSFVVHTDDFCLSLVHSSEAGSTAWQQWHSGLLQ